MENFRKLNISDLPAFKKYLSDLKYELSPYSISSIFMWDECINDVYYYIYKDFLLISEINIKNSENKKLYLPVSKVQPSVGNLLEILNITKYRYFQFVYEDYIEKNRTELLKYFNIIEQQGYMDYIYLSEELSNLKGHKFSKKRNLISQFEKNYLENNLVETLILNRTNIADILTFLDYWHKNSDDLMLDLKECEEKAIKSALNNWDLLELFGISIYINKKISGFAIGSKLSEDTCILHFEKGNKKIKGLYQYLDREFARSLPYDFKFINKESDLNKPGLIKAKESYYPVKKIKSYILERK